MLQLKFALGASALLVLGACSQPPPAPPKPPPPPSEAAVVEAISHSDNYSANKSAFLAAAHTLLSNNTCTLHDFKEMGGWVKSTMTYKNEPVYFTYCGGMKVSNRVYLNAKTGKVFR